MLSEIGSNFWIGPDDLKNEKELLPPYSFGFMGSDYVWMSTGRSATRFVLKTIDERNPGIPKVALLPPFTCHTVIEPFLEYGYKVNTLPVSMNLVTTSEQIVRTYDDTKATVVLLHRYYGFDTLPELEKAVETLRSKGVVVIEDCTQCMYSMFEDSKADYYVGSIRKWCGVPDGGFAICREGTFCSKPVMEDTAMIDIKREASELKYQYLFEQIGDKPTFKAIYREGEALLDAQKDFFKIGDISAQIQANLDIGSLQQKRRANYRVLLERLKNKKSFNILFDCLPDGVTPLYFPILVDEREKLQGLLADNDIYAPVVWLKPECCPTICKEAEEIYQKILCIPIDQRYNTDDMERIIKVITDSSEN